MIAQFDNLDLLFLSCGGRGYDGGRNDGSVSTVVGDELITKKIDGRGTQERLRQDIP